MRRFAPKNTGRSTRVWRPGNPPPFKARLYSHRDQRIDNKAYKLPEAEAREIIAACEQKPFVIRKVERKEVRRTPTPPFITSRLQQEASRKLYFSPSRTMKIAQRLYEGVELGDQGAVGLITYMRTDSARVSDQALNCRARVHRQSLRRGVHARAGEFSTARPSPPRTPTRRFARPRSSAIRNRWRATWARTNWRSTR